MNLLKQYQKHMKTIGLNDRTIQGYVSDMELFARWLADGRGEDFHPANIVPRDLTDYRSHLLTVKGYKRS